MGRRISHGGLGIISFGLAVGVTWALSVAFLAIMAAAFKWGAVFAAVLQNIYLGFSPTFVGAIAGAVWGFVHGFIVGMLIAFFYNRFLSSRHIPLIEHTEQSSSEQA
jgi:hypothetical protein